MTEWTQVVSDDFHRPDTTPGPAGSTTGAGNGWIDFQGSTFYINADALKATTSNPNAYLQAGLIRPSGESEQDSRVVTTYTQGSGTNASSIGICLRVQTNGAIYYLFQIDPDAHVVVSYIINNGTLTNLTTTTNLSLVPGNIVQLDASVIGINPTTINIVVTDVTAGTVLYSTSTTDSTVALQNPGVPGLMVWSAGAAPPPQTDIFTSAKTFTVGGGPIALAITETSSASDNVAASGRAAAMISETTATHDSSAPARGTAVSIHETAAGTDSVAAQALAHLALADSSSAGDLLAPSVKQSLGLSESAAGADGVSAQMHVAPAVQEATAPADRTAAALHVQLGLIETIAPRDLIRSATVYRLGLAEAVSVLDRFANISGAVTVTIAAHLPAPRSAMTSIFALMTMVDAVDVAPDDRTVTVPIDT